MYTYVVPFVAPDGRDMGVPPSHATVDEAIDRGNRRVYGYATDRAYVVQVVARVGEQVTRQDEEEVFFVLDRTSHAPPFRDDLNEVVEGRMIETRRFREKYGKILQEYLICRVVAEVVAPEPLKWQSQGLTPAITFV